MSKWMSVVLVFIGLLTLVDCGGGGKPKSAVDAATPSRVGDCIDQVLGTQKPTGFDEKQAVKLGVALRLQCTSEANVIESRME